MSGVGRCVATFVFTRARFLSIPLHPLPHPCTLSHTHARTNETQAREKLWDGKHLQFLVPDSVGGLQRSKQLFESADPQRRSQIYSPHIGNIVLGAMRCLKTELDATAAASTSSWGFSGLGCAFSPRSPRRACPSYAQHTHHHQRALSSHTHAHTFLTRSLSPTPLSFSLFARAVFGAGSGEGAITLRGRAKVVLTFMRLIDVSIDDETEHEIEALFATF